MAGNRLFRGAKYEDVIKFYKSGALSAKRLTDFWANHSVSYDKLGNWQDPLNDVTQAARLDISI